MAADKQIFEVTFLSSSLDDINDIFYIENQAHSHPWSRNTLLTCFGKLACNCLAFYEGRLVGYFFCRVVAGEAELLNLCVAPEFQGYGVGEQLLKHLQKLLKEQETESIWLEVRETNLRAQSLYHRHGFNEVERRKAYYPSEYGREDALIMSCYL